MPHIAFINGKYMPLGRARVSVEDRGYQFGDGVYEVIRTYGGRFFHLEDHLTRLEASMEAIGLEPVYSRGRWRSILKTAHTRSRYSNAKIYVQVTRGVAPRDHSFPSRPRPSVVVTVRPIEAIPRPVREGGVSVITVPDERWGRCDIKSINLLPNLLARQKARAAGVFEALFVREGMVTEGAGCNIMAVIGRQVITPPKGPAILTGITRDLVAELARAEDIPFFEKAIPLADLYSAGEVFLTGTTIEILPVVAVDGKPVGAGKVGPVTARLHRKFVESTGV